MSRPKTLVILTPAWPADEAPVNWVTTQQLFVRTVKENYPAWKVVVLSFYYPYAEGSYDWHGIRVDPGIVKYGVFCFGGISGKSCRLSAGRTTW